VADQRNFVVAPMRQPRDLRRMPGNQRVNVIAR
jgi:hypothetical protein